MSCPKPYERTGLYGNYYCALMEAFSERRPKYTYSPILTEKQTISGQTQSDKCICISQNNYTCTNGCATMKDEKPFKY